MHEANGRSLLLHLMSSLTCLPDTELMQDQFPIYIHHTLQCIPAEVIFISGNSLEMDCASIHLKHSG